nr:PHD finger protein MALE MEIOCYTE DEATH 1 [Ipomoea trifida]
MAGEVIERDAQELEAGKGRKIDWDIVVQQIQEILRQKMLKDSSLVRLANQNGRILRSLWERSRLRTKRKKTQKFFSLYSFVEAGYPFVDNIRFFLQECASINLRFGAPLYTIEETEIDFGD